jgi:hypothetical protein
VLRGANSRRGSAMLVSALIVGSGALTALLPVIIAGATPSSEYGSPRDLWVNPELLRRHEWPTPRRGVAGTDRSPHVRSLFPLGARGRSAHDARSGGPGARA